MSILKEYYMPIYFYSFIFCFVVTSLFHFVLVNAINKKPATFANKYLLLTTIKLFVYLIFVASYLIFVKINVFWFVIGFLIVYAFFSVFELFEVLSILKKKTN
jgi:hypothetical protein